MAGTSLLTLIDDIASVLDDIATLTKVATKKPAGLLGGDRALNAQQVAGVRAAHELPVVLAVAKGSLRNKLIIVPAALAISIFANWLVTPLLVAGGAFLCFEAFEKLAHRALRREAGEDGHADHKKVLVDSDVDLTAFEQKKIKGAVRTDFILSAVIVVITLGAVATAPFGSRVVVLAGVSLIMTVGVYGLVAAIVRLDDGGRHLIRSSGAGAFDWELRILGALILRVAPYLMKGLSIAGTAAMFLVGGGILAHGIPAVSGLSHEIAQSVASTPGFGSTLDALIPIVLDAAAGVAAGAALVAGALVAERLRREIGFVGSRRR